MRTVGQPRSLPFDDARRAGLRTRRVLAAAGSTVALVALGQVFLPPTAAYAATTTYNVSTTADIAADAGACGDAAITTAPSPLTLREATCLANNVGGPVTINVPAGHYTLTNGELEPGTTGGQSVTITGAGSASTVIDANGTSRAFNIDMNSVGGVNASISGLTITNARDDTFGGAAILDGSYVSPTSDVLTLSSIAITNNTAVGTAQPGGGVQMYGGQLVVTNSAFSGNRSGTAGSAIYYQATGTASPENLSISGSTFAGNAVSNTFSNGASGGALAVSGVAGTQYTVAESRFVNNTVTSSGGQLATGGGIFAASGNLTVTESTFTGNSASGTGAAGPAVYSTGTTTLHYNRLAGNVGAATVDQAGGSVSATDNWWGCNTGPNTTGCETTGGTVVADPRLVLRASANPATVTGPNATSTITGSLVSDSNGTTIAAVNLDAFAAQAMTFSDPPGNATVTTSSGAHAAAVAAGVASIDYHSNTTTGPDPVNITFDNATVTTSVTVDQAPAITSANAAHFDVGSPGSFTVTTTGYPTAAITETGNPPAGLSFVDNGDGTATLAGTAISPGGTFPLTLTAGNGVSPNTTQTLTVTVSQSPAFTSPATVTLRIGTPAGFTVTTSGIPTVTSITESGTLPAGVSFTDNGNGTATLAGAPTGTGGTYPVTLTATNGVAPNATQALTIQVNKSPAITTNPSSQTVNPGTSVTFTAAASGVPTPTVQWQRSTDGGVGFTNIAGATSTGYTLTAASGDNGNLYRAVFTNTVGTATTTAATLNVGTAPAFTSADVASFAVGTAGSFDITTSGVPSATLTRTGTFPAWLTLTDNGDGTGTLTGTPPVGSGGTYSFDLQAANGFSPSATQTLTLSVDESPTITSTDHTTFAVGSAGTFAVTATAGYPTTTGLTVTGALPTGVTFVDHGDGTATLSGTAAAGVAGTYNVTVTATATGGATAPRSQAFTLTVNGPPVITSADHVTFSVGAAGSFAVTTTAGFPTARTVRATGTLPAGVTFTDNGDGTATLSGTPSFGTGGTYPVTVTASNGIDPDATQGFTLTVNEPPIITSANHATFTVGAAAAFAVTTTGGEPAAVTLNESGALPAGVTFVDNGDGTATLGGTPTTGGHFTLTITASNGVGPDPTQSFTITVNEPPVITSADHATFRAGTNGTFTVTTSAGTPSATAVTEIGALPTGVTFVDNGDGTATLSGTPAAGQGGTYPLTVTAGNGVSPPPTQRFTLTVTEPPRITSTDRTTFRTGTAGTFSVTTAPGQPAATTLTETGTLPDGTTFTDNGDGTATLAGIPTTAANGVYPLTITASNGVTPDATQSFILTVSAPPVITSADHATFAVGTDGTFTVTTSPGTPEARTITETGPLPHGVTFVDGHDGTATLAGPAAVGSGGSYPVTIIASNGVSPDATQSFTLTVQESPAITSADHTTFHVGAAGTFTVTSQAGYPTATALTQTGTLPAGITFTDNGDGTATLAGTSATGTGGSYPLTITATNSAGHRDQDFILTVAESPIVTSADQVTFTTGTSGTFTVTTSGGFPTPPSLTESGTLPAGVAFRDNGDGTASLTGSATDIGTFSLTITASNGTSPDATQPFTLTVNGPPDITSASQMTFATGLAGTFTVTTNPGMPATTTLTETGTLPAGITFTDNGDGTATIAGTAPPIAAGSYELVIQASNRQVSATSQRFTLMIARARAVALPATPPASDGPLHGVPPRTTSGMVLRVSGGGYAAGAPITIGSYPSGVLARVTADATGHFTATIRVPDELGRYLVVAAGTGADAGPRYLEAGTLVSAATTPGAPTTPTVPTVPTSTTLPAGPATGPAAPAGLASTGTKLAPGTALDWAAGLTALGAMLLLLGHRSGRRTGRRGPGRRAAGPS